MTDPSVRAASRSGAAAAIPTELEQARRTHASDSDAVVVANVGGRIVDLNAEARRVYGAASNTMPGQPCSALLTSDRREQAELLLIRCLQGELVRNVESVRPGPDGRTYPVRLTFTRVDTARGQPAGVVIIVGDVSELKQAEARLRRMTKVFMDAADPIWIGDLHGLTLEWNREAERLFGWSREEVVGRPGNAVLPPEWHALAGDLRARCERGESIRNWETEVKTRDGRWIPVLINASLLTDDQGEAVGIAAIAKDVRAQKQLIHDLQRKNEELRQFAGIIAHDLREPLTAAHGFCELLQLKHGGRLDADAAQTIRDIIAAANRMQALIDGLLRYARLDRQALPTAPVNCSDVLAQAIDNLRAAIGASGTSVTYDALPVVHGDETQLMELFQNLIANAIRYRGAEPSRIHVTAERGRGIWTFSVQDNGIGIRNEDQERVFEIFAQAHPSPENAGLGLGLAICKKIVERHGGRIWVASEPEMGSTFAFTIPVPGGAAGGEQKTGAA